ncbi:MAG: hypothetical protein QNJ36_20040 [Calothrix sp. MO_167.B42]|nr:hypothetical protein [Calothrix sp. MO_167.B42]
MNCKKLSKTTGVIAKYTLTILTFTSFIIPPSFAQAETTSPKSQHIAQNQPKPKPPQTLKLNLTSGQKEQIRKISQKASADIQKVFTDKQKKAIDAAIKAGTPPQQAFASIKISDQQKLRLQQIMTSFQKDRFDVLTDAQKRQVNEYRKKMNQQQQLQQQQKK